jgi:hypothetical protein
MKIVAETDASLTLEDRPWALAIGLALTVIVAVAYLMSNLMQGDFGGVTLAAAATGLCLSAFAAFVRRIIVIFDRASGRVVVRVASILNQTESGAALADVLRAEVETRPPQRWRRQNDVATHRPILRLREGQTFALTEVFVSGGGAAQVVERINGWLGR